MFWPMPLQYIHQEFVETDRPSCLAWFRCVYIRRSVICNCYLCECLHGSILPFRPQKHLRIVFSAPRRFIAGTWRGKVRLYPFQSTDHTSAVCRQFLAPRHRTVPRPSSDDYL